MRNTLSCKKTVALFLLFDVKKISPLLGRQGETQGLASTIVIKKYHDMSSKTEREKMTNQIPELYGMTPSQRVIRMFIEERHEKMCGHEATGCGNFDGLHKLYVEILYLFIQIVHLNTHLKPLTDIFCDKSLINVEIYNFQFVE